MPVTDRGSGYLLAGFGYLFIEIDTVRFEPGGKFGETGAVGEVEVSGILGEIAILPLRNEAACHIMDMRFNAPQSCGRRNLIRQSRVRGSEDNSRGGRWRFALRSKMTVRET